MMSLQAGQCRYTELVVKLQLLINLGPLAILGLLTSRNVLAWLTRQES